MSDVRIVMADDPQVAVLEADGYQLVGESWGARLRLSDPPELSVFEESISRAEASGFSIGELSADYAEPLYQLELANNADYPFTPATFQAPPELEKIRQLWDSGKRVFGEIDNNLLVAAVVWQIRDGVGDNDFASVLSSHRGRGLGAAVSAASIIAFASEGVRVFCAGGAAVNAASIGLVRSLGFSIEENWRSYQRG
jgi:GNAT superfamily N-acetyltransferase